LFFSFSSFVLVGRRKRKEGRKDRTIKTKRKYEKYKKEQTGG